MEHAMTTPVTDTYSLAELAKLAKEQITLGDAAAQAAGLPYYTKAGEYLLAAKAQCKHGEFSAWLRRNFSKSERSARDYMKLASKVASLPNRQRAADFKSLREAIKPKRHVSLKAVQKTSQVKQKTVTTTEQVLKETARELTVALFGAPPSTAALDQELRTAVAAIRVQYPYEQRCKFIATLVRITMDWDDEGKDETIRPVDWANPRCR